MELRGHENQIECITFAPVAAYNAIRELAGIPVRISRLTSRNPGLRTTLQNTDRSKRSGAYVVTGSRDKTIKLWDTQSGQMLRNFVSSTVASEQPHESSPFCQPGHDNWIRALVFHPSGKYLLSASDDKTIRVWELSTARCIKTVDAHGHFVQTLAWGRQPAAGGKDDSKVNGTDTAANGAPEKLVNVVASGSVDQTVKIWLP